MDIGRQTFEAFSGSLLELARLPAALSPSRLMDEGLAVLRRIVPFDAAWWGECSGGIDGLAPRNWLSGRVKLSADFAREWNRIGATDRFALDSMQRLDAVVHCVGYADPVPEVEAFARRHDLYHVMAITRSLAGSGLLHFVCLYRGHASPAFTPTQSLLFEQFSAHLMQRWSARIAELIGAQAGPGVDGHALVDAHGEFVYVGARFGALLRERFPQWSGAGLPAELAAGTQRLPRQLSLGRRRMSAQRCGELVLLSVAAQRRTPALPPRELNVALLYAEGRSHKQIARETGLSPATVRTYLREAYLRLGVSDKIALGRALDPRHRRRAA
jgi:DNA-binding CsgD family transcriptional regulator